MFSKLFVVITALVAVVVIAQSPTPATVVNPVPPIPTFDTCTAECLSEAAIANGCGTLYNTSCVCESRQFMADAWNCITLDCGADDSNGAEKVYSLVCSAAGVSASGASATPTALPFGQGTNTLDNSGVAPTSA